jgi:BlaI family transcriptional regulator, penicillinase repressor
MARRTSEHPTQLELEILKVLWDRSPLSARDVRDRLKQQSARDLAYSSVITVLNIMVRKGYLKRHKEGKAFLFEPSVDRQSVAGGMTGDLLSRLFDGSASAMVLNLIETADLDAGELAPLPCLIRPSAAGCV